MKNTFQKTLRRLLRFLFAISFIGITINVQAQVINESFEEAEWNTVAGSGTVNLTATTSFSLSYYNSYVTVSTSTISGTKTSTSTVATSSTTITNASGNWLYSGATYTSTTVTALRSVHSMSGSVKLNSSKSFIITPLLPEGVSQVTMWIAGGGSSVGLSIGLLTGTNTLSVLPTTLVNSSLPNLTLTTSFAPSVITSGTATSTFMHQVTYSYSYSDPCQVVIFQTGGSSAYIDDIEITKAVILPQLATPTASNATNISSSGFTANWTDVADDAGYIITVYNPNGSVAKSVDDIAANSTSTIITGLSSNINYTYTVTAVGDGIIHRNSKASEAISVRTLSNQKAITSFVLLGATGVINETAKTINVVVPYSSNLTISHTPTVTVSVHANYIPVGDQPFTEGIPVTYTVTAEDNSTQDYAVTVTKAPASTACSITAFSLGVVNENVAISQASGTITVTVPGTQNITSIVPSISISQSAAITSPASLSTTPFTATDFTNPVIITVLAEDGLAQKQYTVTVTKDATSPVLESSNPSDGSQSASLAGLITLTYDENVKLGSGSITLSGGTLGVPTISGATVKIPFSGLVGLTDYTLTIPAGMFTDMYGNPSAAKTISFKTADGVNRNFPYASHMDGANFDLPAFITGGTYDVTADTKAATTTQYGAYKLAPGEKLTITSSKVGTVQATFYAMGGNRSFTISNNIDANVAYGYFYNYDNNGTLDNPVSQTIDSDAQAEVYLTNTSVSGDVYVGYIYISDVGQPALNEKDVWCK